MNLQKIEGQESWLREQGAKIVNRRPLRRAFFLPPWKFNEEDKFAEPSPVEDVAYTIEVTGTMVHRWMQFQSRLMHIIEHADRNNGLPIVYLTETRERHEKLLEENPMYQQAWQEFQEIRTLLGESRHWP
jgi:hypothetical protein